MPGVQLDNAWWGCNPHATALLSQTQTCNGVHLTGHHCCVLLDGGASEAGRFMSIIRGG